MKPPINNNKPVISEEMRKLLTSLCNKHLTTTYPTMAKYIRTRTFPSDVAVEIEKKTNGRILASFLHPGLFEDLPADKKLACAFLDSFTDQVQSKNFKLLIAVLDFIQIRQPSVYKDMVNQMESLSGGDVFLAQRLAYRPNGKI